MIGKYPFRMREVYLADSKVPFRMRENDPSFVRSGDLLRPAYESPPVIALGLPAPWVHLFNPIPAGKDSASVAFAVEPGVD